MLLQRVITAVVLLAILGAALAWSPTAFAYLATLAIVAAAVEWLQLVGWARGSALPIALVFGACWWPCLPGDGRIQMAMLPAALLAAIVWLGIAGVLMQADALAVRLPRGAASAGDRCSGRRGSPVHSVARCVMLLSVFVVVWLADTAAYFAGRAFGKSKLAPHISPGKTWAGVIGAICSVVVVAFAARALAPSAPIFSNHLLERAGVAGAIVLLVALVAMSIVGDLHESLLKRQAGVKDSSRLLPGHGGILDRIDALVPVLPIAALFDGLTR
jgi:phosphatidate cytidylyltransferase